MPEENIAIIPSQNPTTDPKPATSGDSYWTSLANALNPVTAFGNAAQVVAPYYDAGAVVVSRQAQQVESAGALILSAPSNALSATAHAASGLLGGLAFGGLGLLALAGLVLFLLFKFAGPLMGGAAAGMSQGLSGAAIHVG